MKGKISKVIADFVLKVAKSAAGAASEWSTYQPKEPEMLKKISK
jgi:cyclic lactone autoinducer peptide